jgi:hypothetical protein
METLCVSRLRLPAGRQRYNGAGRPESGKRDAGATMPLHSGSAVTRLCAAECVPDGPDGCTIPM